VSLVASSCHDLSFIMSFSTVLLYTLRLPVKTTSDASLGFLYTVLAPLFVLPYCCRFDKVQCRVATLSVLQIVVRYSWILLLLLGCRHFATGGKPLPLTL